jgi:Arc/MetJ-type ribon-helix-helix transcriptional regulator
MITRMQVRLNRPELERFIDEQVKTGRFTSPDAAVEAAVEHMMLQPDVELDQETIDAINRAESQIDRGEGIDFASFAAIMRKRMAAGQK